MVDIVGFYPHINDFAVLVGCRYRLVAFLQRQEVFETSDNIVQRQSGGMDITGKTQFPIDLVATNFGQVIALGVEVEAFNQVTTGFCASRLAGPDLAVNICPGVIGGLNVVRILFQGGKHDRIVFEFFANFFRRHPQGTQENGAGLFTAPVNTDAYVFPFIDL